MDELEAMLAADKKKASEIWERHLRAAAEETWYLTELLDRRILRDSDPVATGVKQWVTENCQMDDGLIPVLNFEQMAIYFHGCRIAIKDGISDFINYCACLNCGGGYNLGCACQQCADARNALSTG